MKTIEMPQSQTDLPAGWARSSVGLLSLAIQYGHTASAKSDPNGPRFLRITDIQNGGVDWPAVPSCKIDEGDFDKYALRPGDIVFARTGATTGKSFLIQNCPKAVFASYLIRLRPHPATVPAFLSLFFQTPEYWQAISENVSGNAQPGCNASKLSEITLPLAPSAEQRRIVAKVEELLARVNAARARLAKVPALLKHFRQSVLAAACSGQLTADWREDSARGDAAEIVAALEHAHATAGGHKRGNAAEPTDDAHDLDVDNLPKTWHMTDLRTAVCPDRPITYGILKPGPDAPSGIPYVRVADFPNDRLNLSTVRRTTPEIERTFARARLRPGDILLSIRGTVGRVCVAPKDLQGANITQDTARLSIQPSLCRDFVVWFLRSKPTQQRMQKALKGVAVRGINIGDVRALQLPVPSLAEQHEIVRRVDALFAVAAKIEARVQAATARVERITQSILAKAFRGELVPTEAELARQQNRPYEPATALLARIKHATVAASTRKSKLATRE